MGVELPETYRIVAGPVPDAPRPSVWLTQVRAQIAVIARSVRRTGRLRASLATGEACQIRVLVARCR